MTRDEIYMSRCFELARLAGKNVKTNPNVGAVLVYNDRIIGEGYHENFGGHHAEKNAILHVSESDKHLVKDACLYVSLEPCNIESKTPACTALISQYQIKKVKISVEDPNPAMRGKSLKMLQEQGVEIESGILAEEGHAVIKPFQAQLNKRPYIILKWAQSTDNYISKKGEQVWLSNSASKRKVHYWRSQLDAILIGYNTALIDNPKLTTRLVPGSSPVRMLIDRDLSLPRTHHLWADAYPTIFICCNKIDTEGVESNSLKSIYPIDFEGHIENQICKMAFSQGLYRIMVEGGSKTLKGFINSGLWDEARIIKCPVQLKKGVAAPFIQETFWKMERFLNNDVHYYLNNMV